MDYGILAQEMAAEVSAARARSRLSNAEVAEAMRERGFKWHAQTASMAQAGGRRLTAEEMVALSEIFDRPVTELLRVPLAQVLADMGLLAEPTGRMTAEGEAIEELFIAIQTLLLNREADVDLDPDLRRLRDTFAACQPGAL